MLLVFTPPLISVSKAAVTVNQYLADEDCECDKMYGYLSAPQLAYTDLLLDCSQHYVDKLKEAKTDKSEKGMIKCNQFFTSCIVQVFRFLNLPLCQHMF